MSGYYCPAVNFTTSEERFSVEEGDAQESMDRSASRIDCDSDNHSVCGSGHFLRSHVRIGRGVAYRIAGDRLAAVLVRRLLSMVGHALHRGEEGGSARV